MSSRRRKTCKTASSGRPFAAVLLPTLLTTGSRIFAFPTVRRIFRALCKDIGLVSLAARRATLDGVHHSIVSSPTQRYGPISLQGAVRRVTDGTIALCNDIGPMLLPQLVGDMSGVPKPTALCLKADIAGVVQFH
jgi:hypothetical protein